MSAAELKELYHRCVVAAQISGDRAYVYAYAGSQKVEVRVWPDGTGTLTPVDEMGMPVGDPAPLEY